MLSYLPLVLHIPRTLYHNHHRHLVEALDEMINVRLKIINLAHSSYHYYYFPRTESALTTAQKHFVSVAHPPYMTLSDLIINFN